MRAPQPSSSKRRRSTATPARSPAKESPKGTRRVGSRDGGNASDENRTRIRLDVDERRAQLVELGLAEFGTRTYDDVSIDLIAQSAGISKGLLYHYFPTKRAFYQACVREAAARLLARLELPTDVSPLERLNFGLERYLEYVRAHGSAFATLMRSGAYADRELAAVVDATRASLLEKLTSGMADMFPASVRASSLLKLALEGWIGLAEAMSIAWVEACVEAERARSKNSRAPSAPSAKDVRDLLAQALVAIVQSSASL
jgi:AcrR family transcriptional regulator